jgi:pyruvate/2-oxoglutarate dehydrogenase complex dihydrolipoamide acyltransferase (E2) component
MKKLDTFKNLIHESIVNGMVSAGGVNEGDGMSQKQAAGLVATGGPQSVADIISKMDQATFNLFVSKIDAKGLEMIGQQASVTPPVAAPATSQPAGNNALPDAPTDAALDQELKDL